MIFVAISIGLIVTVCVLNTYIHTYLWLAPPPPPPPPPPPGPRDLPMVVVEGREARQNDLEHLPSMKSSNA